MKNIILTLTAFVGVCVLLSGILMLYDPTAWFETVPGMTHTGIFNQHFVRDIEIVALFIGAAYM